MQCLQVVCLIVVITLSAAAAALPPYLDLAVCLQPPNILPPWQESLLKSSKTPKSSWFSAWNLLWGHIPSICHQIWLWSFSKTPVGVNWVQQSGAISKKNWIGSPLNGTNPKILVSNILLYTCKGIAFLPQLFCDAQLAIHFNIINIYAHCWQTDEQHGSNYC